jgi:hypothetical protein
MVFNSANDWKGFVVIFQKILPDKLSSLHDVFVFFAKNDLSVRKKNAYSPFYSIFSVLRFNRKK